MKDDAEPWYAVRCFLSHPTRAKQGDGTLYEERITIWKTGDEAEAYRLAREEAAQYAEESDSELIGTTDAFHLFDKECGHGSEVWSTMRGSFLDRQSYIDTFCCTPRDRNHDFVEPEDPEAQQGVVAEG